jgi:hypothetical protein
LRCCAQTGHTRTEWGKGRRALLFEMDDMTEGVGEGRGLWGSGMADGYWIVRSDERCSSSRAGLWDTFVFWFVMSGRG